MKYNIKINIKKSKNEIKKKKTDRKIIKKINE